MKGASQETDLASESATGAVPARDYARLTSRMMLTKARRPAGTYRCPGNRGTAARRRIQFFEHAHEVSALDVARDRPIGQIREAHTAERRFEHTTSEHRV